MMCRGFLFFLLYIAFLRSKRQMIPCCLPNHSPSPLSSMHVLLQHIKNMEKRGTQRERETSNGFLFILLDMNIDMIQVANLRLGHGIVGVEPVAVEHQKDVETRFDLTGLSEGALHSGNLRRLFLWL